MNTMYHGRMLIKNETFQFKFIVKYSCRYRSESLAFYQEENFEKKLFFNKISSTDNDPVRKVSYLGFELCWQGYIDLNIAQPQLIPALRIFPKLFYLWSIEYFLNDKLARCQTSSYKAYKQQNLLGDTMEKFVSM